MEQRVEKRVTRPVVVRPERVRQINGRGFGWLDSRLVRDGWLDILAPMELAVYAFLCLVSDRQGVSWYRRGYIAAKLAIAEDELHFVLRRLSELDLVAYQPFYPGAAEGFHQVLSVPPGGPAPMI
jgi:hypothetical protein